jgi:hypothetical protein
MRYPNYEIDSEAFPAEAYSVEGYRGIAWYVIGWETQPDEDTAWTGYEAKTGKVVAVMVGDDRRFTFAPDELTPLERVEYCGVCGQVGCGHDGLDRED